MNRQVKHIKKYAKSIDEDKDSATIDREREVDLELRRAFLRAVKAIERKYALKSDELKDK